MTEPFLDLPLSINGEELLEAVYDDMAEQFPGWEAAPGSPESFLLRSIVYRLIVPVAQAAVTVGGQLFFEFGTQIVNLAPQEALSASVLSTWTMIDDAGYTIPKDAEVDIAVSGDQAVGFRVAEEVGVAPGATETAEGEVELVALVPGAEGNGLSGEALSVEAFSFIASIALEDETAGGQDAEDPLAYLARLSATLQTLGPHPIIARDVETLARNTTGVARATTLDLFDPDNDDPDDPDTWDSEKHCSVAVTDEDGEACTTPVKDAVLADLQAKRETNFVFHVLDADYNEIDAEFSVVPLAGFAQEGVDALVALRLAAFLSPAEWGLDAQRSPGSWINRRTIRFQELVTLVNETQGCDYYELLEFGPASGPLATDDLEMTGAAPLPRPGSIAPAGS